MTMEITQWQATQQDALFIANVSKNVGLSWSLNDYLQDIQSEHALYLVNQAGFIGAHIVCGEGEIINIAIQEKYQGKGYAKKLWQGLLLEFTKRNVTQCFLEVRESNVRAQRFYESIGFMKITERKNYYKLPTEHAWIYRWEKA